MTVPPVGDELFHVDRRTDTINVILAFGYFVKAPTKERTPERQADFPISFSLICSKSVQSFLWLSTSRRKTAAYILLSRGKRTVGLNRPPSSDNQFPGEENFINSRNLLHIKFAAFN
jgi:hypothetical protein